MTSGRERPPRGRGVRKVLIVSPLPPALGGVATWAGIIRANGLGDRYEPLFLDTSKNPGTVAVQRSRELSRSGRIIGGLLRALIRHGRMIVHLTCCISRQGVFRDLLLAVIARTTGSPVVTHYRGDIPQVLSRFDRISRLAFSALVRVSTWNIAVTRESHDYLSDAGDAERASFLPNFVEDEILARELDISRFRQSPETLAYVGRLSRDKGGKELLEVAQNLPRVEFLVVGEVEEDLEDSARSATPNVRILGALGREETLSVLEESTLLVFPSYREGFPNSVLEAMAVGLPVIATTVGAIPEMLDNGRGGLLVAPGSAHALTAAIREVVSDGKRLESMGDHNRDKCSREYAFSVVKRELVELYDRVMPSPITARIGHSAAS
ncbi:glycosyltransferase family 4 protein [bacterium]|nr:glycosyltransferase family 4 protein [bacterium]